MFFNYFKLFFWSIELYVFILFRKSICIMSYGEFNKSMKIINHFLNKNPNDFQVTLIK